MKTHPLKIALEDPRHLAAGRSSVMNINSDQIFENSGVSWAV